MAPITSRGIIRYADSRGRAGKLLGVITFLDGKELKVWDEELHAKCQAFAKFPIGEVRYTFKHSPKWGDSLATITRDQEDWQLVDVARAADEASGPIHRVTGFAHDMTKKRVQTHVDAAKAADLLNREGRF